jgi:hypothetical protein
MNWLRKVLGKLNRRWIRDPEERQKHDIRVRRRLKGEAAEDEPATQAASDTPT